MNANDLWLISLLFYLGCMFLVRSKTGKWYLHLHQRRGINPVWRDADKEDLERWCMKEIIRDGDSSNR